MCRIIITPESVLVGSLRICVNGSQCKENRGVAPAKWTVGMKELSTGYFQLEKEFWQSLYFNDIDDENS